MANGKPNDHPLTDMLFHGAPPFPGDMEGMLRAILEVDPVFPDGKRPYVEQVRWEHRFWDWVKGENLDEGRQALKKVLTEIQMSNFE